MNSKSIKKNTVFNTIKTFSTIVYPLITFPYISRTLLVENIGKVNFGLSFISYFSLLSSLGISVYAIRECSKFNDDRKKLSNTASEIFSLNVLTTIFSYILLFFILLFYKKIESYRTLIAIQSLSILFSTIGTDWLNTALEDFKYITTRTIFFQIMSLILLFLFIHSPQDYIKYAVINVISSSGYNLVNIFYRRKFCDIKFTMNIDIKKHCLPIIYLFVMLFSQTIFNNVDMTMLGTMKGDYAVGVYSVAHKICNLVSQIVSSLLWVVIPRISYYFNKSNFTEINKLLSKILNFNITLGIPCAVGTFILSDDIVLIIAGNEFFDSSIVLKILMLGFLISLFAGSFIGNVIMLSMGQEKYFMIVCVITAIVNIILNYLMIPYFSYNGAAATTSICSLTMFILLLYKLDNRIIIKNIPKMLFDSVTGCVAIVLICYFLTIINSIYIRTILSILLSILVYFSLQLLLKNELCISTLNSILKRIHRIKL